MSRLRILYVAYPLLPISEESCGGAEQVLVAIEREMRRRDHETTVAAAARSRVAGELCATVSTNGHLDYLEQASRLHAAGILDLVRRHEREGTPFDLIHDHSGSWWRHAAEVNAPVLATLHLPRKFYAQDAFHPQPNLFFNCVSRNQFESFRGVFNENGAVVPNGIDLDLYRPGAQKKDFLLWLGRFCHEKGAHVAIDVAQRAGSRLVLAGCIFPFTYHQNYFEREIAPNLKDGIELRPSPARPEKIALLQSARAVLIPSLVDETSSLVAMEALACGTPVLTYNRGALRDLIENGVNGRLVGSTEEMAAAISELDKISTLACRARAEELCSRKRMCDSYEQLYSQVIARFRNAGLALAA